MKNKLVLEKIEWTHLKLESDERSYNWNDIGERSVSPKTEKTSTIRIKFVFKINYVCVFYHPPIKTWVIILCSLPV